VGDKGSWCIQLTTLPPSCADCLEIWEPRPPGTPRACPSLHRGCCTFVHQVKYYKTNCSFSNITKRINILTLNFNTKSASKCAKAWKYSIPTLCRSKHMYIQGIHKRMVRFQKVTRNVFLTLHGPNVHRQQRKLSKFLVRYQQFASHA